MLDSENLQEGCNSFCDDGTGNQALTNHSKDVGYLICMHSLALKDEYNENHNGDLINKCERMVAHDYQSTNIRLDELLTKYRTNHVDWN